MATQTHASDQGSERDEHGAGKALSWQAESNNPQTPRPVADKTGSVNGKSGRLPAQQHQQLVAQEQHTQPQLWDNFESMDDETISGVIEAARRAGVRRRMWDN